MRNIEGDKLRGHLETMALATLERGPAHGLDVLKSIERAGCGALQLKEGSLYPALYRLEQAGLVEAEWEEGDNGRRGPRRRIYRLTRKGKQQLAEGRADWQQFVTVIGTILGAPA